MANEHCNAICVQIVLDKSENFLCIIHVASTARVINCLPRGSRYSRTIRLAIAKVYLVRYVSCPLTPPSFPSTAACGRQLYRRILCDPRLPPRAASCVIVSGCRLLAGTPACLPG